MSGLRRKWRRMRAAALVVAALGGAGPSCALADRITLIVDRGPRAVEVFLAMPVSTAVTRFGLNPDLLKGPGGVVDFADFSGGTWDIGDALLAGVDVRIGRAPAGFEATSLMVHLKDQPLPFQTPFDGLTAISVCGVAQPVTPPTLDDLYLYAGFVAYPPNAEAPLRFDLPEGPGERLSVTVREYGAGRTGTPRNLHLDPGQPLILGQKVGLSLWGLGLATVALCGIVALRAVRRS